METRYPLSSHPWFRYMLAAAVLLASGWLVLAPTPTLAASEAEAEARLPAAVTYYVDDGFTPSTPGWGTTHFASIQAALDKTVPGDTVNVAAGTYAENVTVGASVTVNINGNALLQGHLTNAGWFQLLANFSLTGNFTNSGYLLPGTRTFTFSSGMVQELHTLAPTNFYNLVVAPGTTLIEAETNNWVFMSGVLTNNGTIRKILAVGGSGENVFGLTGVKIDVSTLGTLNQVQVERIDSNHPNGSGQAGGFGTLTGRYWIITPNAGAGSFSTTLTLPHNLGVNHAEAYACRYTGSGFDCARSSSDTSFVWRNEVSQFSSWTIGVHVTPTAVSLERFEAAAAGFHPVGLLAVAPVLLGLLAGPVILRRRQ